MFKPHPWLPSFLNLLPQTVQETLSQSTEPVAILTSHDLRCSVQTEKLSYNWKRIQTCGPFSKILLQSCNIPSGPGSFSLAIWFSPLIKTSLNLGNSNLDWNLKVTFIFTFLSLFPPVGVEFGYPSSESAYSFLCLGSLSFPRQAGHLLSKGGMGVLGHWDYCMAETCCSMYWGGMEYLFEKEIKAPDLI